MLKSLISDKIVQKIAESISQKVEKSFSSYRDHTTEQLDHILTHVEALRLELKSLDERLTIKEVKDRSEYGHVQYKLSSLQSEILSKKPDCEDDEDGLAS